MVYQKKQGMRGDKCINFNNFNNGRKWKKAGTEKVLHNEYSRGIREDANKTLNKNAAINLNILRKLTISILEGLPFRKKFSRKIV